MPHGDGFDLLARLPAPLPVVFVTAHSEFAVQAFEVDAVDYLLKPVRPHRLATAVARLRHALGQSPVDPVYSDSDRICLRTPGRTVVAPADDLILLEADGDFTRITTEGGHPLLVCRTLGSFAETLPSPPLLRLDRSLMVNVERVETIEVSPTRGARVTLRGLSAPVELGPHGPAPSARSVSPRRRCLGGLNRRTMVSPENGDAPVGLAGPTQEDGGSLDLENRIRS